MGVEQVMKFSEELKKELLAVSLPSDPRDVIGHVYLFGYEEGSHPLILAGTVTGIEISYSYGLVLRVSNSRISDMEIIGLSPNSQGDWAVMVKRGSKDLFFQGEFQLL